MGNQFPTIDGVRLTEEKIIKNTLGDIFHCLKSDSDGYHGFGEAYISKIKQGAIKGWKRHHRMTMNILVLQGCIRFVIFDDRDKSSTAGLYQNVYLEHHRNLRLTVPPLVWVAFQGIEINNMLLNISDIKHDPCEADKKEACEIEYSWGTE